MAAAVITDEPPKGGIGIGVLRRRRRDKRAGRTSCLVSFPPLTEDKQEILFRGRVKSGKNRPFSALACCQPVICFLTDNVRALYDFGERMHQDRLNLMADLQLDTVDALMARYAAGVLPDPARVLVEAHLEMKSDNWRKVAGFEVLAAGILEDAEPVALRSRDRALDAIFSAAPINVVTAAAKRPRAGLLPRALQDFIGFDVDEIPWKSKLPGFKEFNLGRVDGCDVSLFWIRAGRAVPAHTHEGYELSLILDGAFNDSRGRFAKGDISVADERVDHRPVAEKQRPCIGFAVSDAPLKLTGSLGQLLGDLIG